MTIFLFCLFKLNFIFIFFRWRRGRRRWRRCVKCETRGFFFGFGQGPLFAHALHRAAGKQPAPVGIFFLWILISSLSVCLLYTPLMIPFIPTFFSPPFFYRDTTQHETPHNVRKTSLSEQPPHPSLWFCNCVWTNARIHLFFSPSET